MGDLGIGSNPKLVTVAQNQEHVRKNIVDPAWQKWREQGSNPMETPDIAFGVEGDIDPHVGWALTDAEYFQAQELVAKGVSWDDAVKHVTGKTSKQIAAERHAAQSPHLAAAREKLEAGDYQGAIGILNNMWQNNIGNRQT